MSAERRALVGIVDRKSAGGTHTHDEIEALVRGYTAGVLGDEAFTPWLRSVLEHGLSDDETVWLTQAMAASGTTLSWSGVDGIVVDKHSTGGVGDDVSLIAVPLAAACGVKVAKLSGRALGHTGGTIDKLECIPGLRTDLSAAAFERQVAEVGCAIAQASDEIAPADKKIYALRHRTNTVESIGLITASVLSKKIAGGAPHLVIDVKCGRSAFMQTLGQALALARSIARVGSRCGRSVTVLVTDMDVPLAGSIGDALELDEALGVLSGRGGGKLRAVALLVAEAMLAVHERDERQGAPARMAALENALRDGSAYRRFAAMVNAQGGDVSRFEPERRPALTIEARSSGFISGVDGRAIGEAVTLERSEGEGPAAGARPHVALRSAGVRLHKIEGEAIAKGEPLADLFGAAAERMAQTVREAIRIGPRPPLARPLVIERLHAQPVTGR